MQAYARVTAEPGPDGRTRLSRLRSQAPLVVRPTAGGVTLVAGAGGPIGGDDLRVDLELAPDATLRVGSAAAMVVQPGTPAGPGAAARVTVRAELGTGACLRWEPEPTVVTADAVLQLRVELRLAAGAGVVWREVLVLGRDGEPGGSVTAATVVDVEDQPVLRQELRFGAGAPAGWDGPAGLGGHRVLGTLLLLGEAGRDVEAASGDGTVPFAVMPLAGGGALVTVLAATTLAVSRVLDDCAAGVRA